MRMMLREALEEDGYTVEDASGGRAGIERVKQGGVDLVISDVKMPDLDGLDMLREIKAVTPSPHVITITAFGSIDTAIRAVKLGAFDYITKPFDVDQLILSVQKALDERALRSELARLRDEVQRSYRWGNIIGKSAAMQEMFALIRRLSRFDRVGAGDGRVGDGQGAGRASAALQQPAPRPAVRRHQLRRDSRDAAGERAVRLRARRVHRRAHRRAGLFVEADGGTIFLDEIGELPPALQAKLLRVLQEGEIRPLGAARSQQVDVRVVAATNRELEANLASGAFRAGPLLPAERDAHPPAAAARSRRGHPAAGRALPGAERGARGQGRAGVSRGREEGAARSTPGPGTCASWRTSSSARSRWSRGR